MNFSIADQCNAWQFRCRIGVCEAAADGAAVSNLGVGNVGSGNGDQRIGLGDFRIGLELSRSCHRADMQSAVVVDTNVGQFRHAV